MPARTDAEQPYGDELRTRQNVALVVRFSAVKIVPRYGEVNARLRLANNLRKLSPQPRGQ